MRHALNVCRTNCISNSEYSSPLLPRMSITRGNARRNASSIVNPLIPRLYTCGSNRSSSRRRGILSQSCLMLFFSVMPLLYLTEASETTMNYLQIEVSGIMLGHQQGSWCSWRAENKRSWFEGTTLGRGRAEAAHTSVRARARIQGYEETRI